MYRCDGLDGIERLRTGQFKRQPGRRPCAYVADLWNNELNGEIHGFPKNKILPHGGSSQNSERSEISASCVCNCITVSLWWQARPHGCGRK